MTDYINSMVQEEKATYYVNNKMATTIKVRIDEDTVWLTQAQMVDLFETTKQNISLHINNIFKEGELNKSSVVKESLTTAKDGKRYKSVSNGRHSCEGRNLKVPSLEFGPTK